MIKLSSDANFLRSYLPPHCVFGQQPSEELKLLRRRLKANLRHLHKCFGYCFQAKRKGLLKNSFRVIAKSPWRRRSNL